ncbi:hypothetical protein [Paraclostridium bifermentans]|uniref:hypothetical protein n=1 Tax=Paraclostridium bifermentans TaxID=1490 RepID=UPI00359CB6E7
MKSCIVCNYRFIFKDRFKGTVKYLKCSNCSTSYNPKFTIYVFLYNFLVFFTAINLQFEFNMNNKFLEFILFMLIVCPVLLLYHLVPHRFQKYDIIKPNEKDY